MERDEALRAGSGPQQTIFRPLAIYHLTFRIPPPPPPSLYIQRMKPDLRSDSLLQITKGYVNNTNTRTCISRYATRLQVGRPWGLARL